MAVDIRLLAARLFLEAGDTKPNCYTDEDINNGQHWDLDQTPKHHQRKGEVQETIWSQGYKKACFFAAAGINHTVTFRNLKRCNPSKGNHCHEGMCHLVGIDFNDIDVFFQKPIHEREYNCSSCEPEIPWVVSAFVIAKPFRQVADMMRQRRPYFGYEENPENDEHDTKQYV